MFRGTTQTIVSIVLYFTLCLNFNVSSGTLTNLQNYINLNVSVKPLNNYFTNVNTYKNYDVYDYMIYTYDDSETNNKSKNPVIYKINMFFIHLNCKIADWTQSELFTYISKFPRLLLDNEDYNVFKRDNEKHIESLKRILISMSDNLYIYYKTL